MARKKRDENFDDFREEVADLFGARLDVDSVRDIYDALARDLGYLPDSDDVETYADFIFDALAEEELVDEGSDDDWFIDEGVEEERAEQELRDRDRGDDYWFDEGEEIELSIDTAYDES